jgi:hypothetical protein
VTPSSVSRSNSTSAALAIAPLALTGRRRNGGSTARARRAESFMAQG